MTGTVEGGKKAALTNLSLYGNEFYRKTGSKGGKARQAKARANAKKIAVE